MPNGGVIKISSDGSVNVITDDSASEPDDPEPDEPEPKALDASAPVKSNSGGRDAGMGCPGLPNNGRPGFFQVNSGNKVNFAIGEREYPLGEAGIHLTV